MSVAAKAAARDREIPQARITHSRDLRLRAMFEGAAIGIGICALNGRILEGNAALSKMLGYSREELAGMNAREFHPGDFQQDEALLSELMGGTRNSFELEKHYLRKDGSYLWGRLTVSLMREAGGEPAFLIAMLEDTTERKRVAEQLREAEKMEVIGRLAGGIAHDFNNLLTGILLYCDLLAAELQSGSRQRQHVDEIRMAGEQGAALTQQLLAIARKQVPQTRPILLNEVVSSTENLLRRLIGEQIELVTALDPKIGRVLADQAELRQVLLNLVLNARDAMPQGGTITASTHVRTLSRAAQAAVALRVEDTGCGMDDRTRARLFEPFFTTKKPGHGTGLGLATVQRIVSESGGKIQVESEAGHGTRIEIVFPAVKAVPETRMATLQPHADETILVVDDHASARNSLQRVLHHAGYRVLQASSGKRALKVFAEHANDVDLLITDSMMPGMSGRELADKLQRQKAGLKVLLISGFHDEQSGHQNSVEMIRKPFASRVLMERIREVLDCKRGQPC
jgi:two-component system, cell cycle sensor histidine kinase and response regulator CckA